MMMKRNVAFLLVALLFASIAYAATNYVQEGDVVTLSWATTSVSAGDPCIKCTAKATGAIVGVSLTGTGTAAESHRVATKGVFDLNVTTTSTTTVAIGDYVYAAVGGVEVGIATLTDDPAGVVFGRALEAISATSTTSRINVLLGQ